jgi:hypothetical protein
VNASERRQKVLDVAAAENKRMLEPYGYRGPNYGIKNEVVEGRTGRFAVKQGRPLRLNSKIIMDMTTEGRNANEIAAALNMQRKSVIRTARRHGIDIIK